MKRGRLVAAVFVFACVCSRLGATNSVVTGKDRHAESIGSRLGCFEADGVGDNGASARSSLDGAPRHRFAIVAIACNGTDYLQHRGDYQLERCAQLARNLNRVIPKAKRSQVTTVLLLSGYDSATRVPGFDRHIVVGRKKLQFRVPKRAAGARVGAGHPPPANEAPSWALPPEAQTHLRKKLPGRRDGACT